MISAEIHSDDYLYKADFDATKWAEQASDEDILALVSCGGRGDYPADEVAEWEDDHSTTVREVFNYVAKHGSIGFEVSVNMDELKEWLKINRPDVWNVVLTLSL